MSILIFGIKKNKNKFYMYIRMENGNCINCFIFITFILKMKLKYFKIESIEIRLWIFNYDLEIFLMFSVYMYFI